MALSNHEFLLVLDALIKRWAELTREDLQRDIAAFEGKDVFASWAVRAYWDRFTQAMLKVGKVIRKPATPAEELRLVERMYGEQLGLPGNHTSQDVEARLEWFKRRVAKDFERRFRDAVNQHKVESPIEQIFLMEWAASGLEAELRVKLVPQKTIATDEGQYRMDFEVTPTSSEDVPFRVCIELDGHEFHERTPHQAAQDKKRERAIVRAGVTVLRFTGSEVFRNSRSCVSEVASFIRGRRRRDGS